MSENVKKAPGFKDNLTEFMQKYKVGAFFQKYTMLIALVVVTIVFASWKGKEGLILLPPNITGLIAENAYVFVLAAGMLLCILTGGNIDLACGSVVCFVGAIGAVMMDKDINWVLAVIGSLMIIIYGILRHDWVLVIGQFAIVFSVRNIMLYFISKRES